MFRPMADTSQATPARSNNSCARIIRPRMADFAMFPDIERIIGVDRKRVDEIHVETRISFDEAQKFGTGYLGLFAEFRRDDARIFRRLVLAGVIEAKEKRNLAILRPSVARAVQPNEGRVEHFFQPCRVAVLKHDRTSLRRRFVSREGGALGDFRQGVRHRTGSFGS